MNNNFEESILVQSDSISGREADAADALSRMFRRTTSIVGDDNCNGAVGEDQSASGNVTAVSYHDQEMEEVQVATSSRELSSTGAVNAAQPKARKRGEKRVCQKHDERLVRDAIDKHINQGMSKAAAAESVHMAPTTFSAYVARYRASRGLHIMPQGRAGRKATDYFDRALVRSILQYIDSHPTCAVEDVVARCIEVTIAEIPKSRLQKWLQKNARITFERFCCFPISQTEEEKMLVFDHCREITGRSGFNPTGNVLFFAEAAFAVNPRRTYPASPKVSPPHTTDPTKLTPDLRVLVAISDYGLAAFSVQSFSGFTTADEMSALVDSALLAMPAKEGECWYFGFDCLPPEVATPLFKIVEEAGHVPFFFPEDSVSWNAADYLMEDLLLTIDRKLLESAKKEKLADRTSAAVGKITAVDCHRYVLSAFPDE